MFSNESVILYKNHYTVIFYHSLWLHHDTYCSCWYQLSPAVSVQRRKGYIHSGARSTSPYSPCYQGGSHPGSLGQSPPGSHQHKSRLKPLSPCEWACWFNPQDEHGVMLIVIHMTGRLKSARELSSNGDLYSVGYPAYPLTTIIPDNIWPDSSRNLAMVLAMVLVMVL